MAASHSLDNYYNNASPHSESDFEATFDDPFRELSSPTPPPSFLDNILNPADAARDPLNRRAPPSPAAQQANSPALPRVSAYATTQMPTRPSRLASGYVDLTNEPDEPPRQRKRASPSPGPSTKRMKRDNGTATKPTPKVPAAPIEEIDLSDDKTDIREILEKQRTEAVLAQQKPEEKATTFNNFTCVICMDTPKDITATSCGHLFCHTCLMEALIAGENRSGPNEPKRSQCPVCRKHINRAKTTDIIPLLLMKKGLATQPRKRRTSSTGRIP
jgi:hypothetical protein